MPLPSLIMGLIAKTQFKFPSGLTIVQRDYPIGAHIVNRSTSHIKGSKIGVHTIPQHRVEDEGGDTKEKIDRFTSIPESSAQPSSSAPAWGPNRLDRILARVEQMYTMLDSHVQRTAYSKPVHLCSRIDHRLIYSDRGVICQSWFRLRVRGILALWPFRSKRGRKF